jgi:hypothetical protein
MKQKNKTLPNDSTCVFFLENISRLICIFAEVGTYDDIKSMKHIFSNLYVQICYCTVDFVSTGIYLLQKADFTYNPTIY